MTIKLGWFSSGRCEDSRVLLAHTLYDIGLGKSDAHIQFVLSNRDPGEHEGSDKYFQLVRHHGIPLVCYSSQQFRK